MFRRNLIIICAALYLVVFAAFAHAQLPQITNGLSYLTSSQNPDGTWTTSAIQAEINAATISTLETLKLLNQTAGTSYTTGSSWLQGQTPQTVDDIAKRIIVLHLADGSALIPTLDSLKGAWGGYSGYENDILDTAFALQALKSGSYIDPATINLALAYLIVSQNPDGGWGFTKDDSSTNSGQVGTGSNVYFTAIVSATLQQFPQTTPVATAVSRASAYLLARQNADGGFGTTVYETALSYIALVADGQTGAQQAPPLQNAVNYLIATQTANGSWNDDPYSTALALKALYCSENKPASPPPPPSAGKLSGKLVDSITQQPVSGVSVALAGNPLISVTSDSLGNFILSDVPPGSQVVNLANNGFAPAMAAATSIANTTTNLGNIPMTSSYSTGTIAGTITDSTGKPLTGVAITVTGAWSGSATSGADGTYSFSYVTPGTVTISAAKTGYQTVTANGTVYARTTLTFSPRMSTMASQVTTGTLVGRVIDSYWGVPIGHLPEETGVQVTVSGAAPLAVEPEGGGYFTIPNLAPGTYQVIVGMHGFASHTYQIVIPSGGTTDLGTIRLEFSFQMTLAGKITDASTGAPLSGAEVIIQGKDFTGRTDSFGTYAIADIPNPGVYTIKASADGYIGKSYTIGSSPWLHTMDFALSPRITKGGLTGIVINAVNSQPLAGVSLTLVSDTSVNATTNSSGTFILNAVPPGLQQVTLALDGYTPRTLSTVIRVGVVGYAGKLSLGVTELPATIQGTAQVGADAPFAGVTIRTTGDTPLQTVTAADGTYALDAVPPGTVTVTANALSNPEFTSARFTSILEPGGILVFNPALSMMLSGTFDLTAKTDKAVYGLGDTVGISINLRNREAEAIVAALHVRVTDPNGVSVYETGANVSIDADRNRSAPELSLADVSPERALHGSNRGV